MVGEFFMGRERRVYERISYYAPCRYEISLDEKRSQILESGTSFVKNISIGGILMEMLKSISINSKVDLEIILPTTPQPIRAQARVAWTSKLEENGNRYNVGMCFTEIDSQDKGKISSLKTRIEDIEKI